MGRRAWNALAGICLWSSAVRLAGAAEATPSSTTDVSPSSSEGSSGPSVPVAPSSSPSPAAPLPTVSPNASGASPAADASPNPAAANLAVVPTTPAASAGNPSPASRAPEPSVSPAAVAPLAQPSRGSALRAQAALLDAERAVLEVDYEHSLTLAQQAINDGNLTRDEVRRAYLALALSAAQLDRQDVALPAFLRLFAIDPDVEISKRVAPARRSAAISAQQYWSSHRQKLALHVDFDREERQLVVRTSDPLSWVNGVHVWVRKPGNEYLEYSLASGSEVKLALDVESLDILDVYAYGLDDRGNVVVEHASAEEPQRLTPELEDAINLERDIRGGETGSVAQRLAPAAATSVNGYASLELGSQPDGKGAAFDLSHATLYLHSQLYRHASVDLALDAGHLAQSHRDLTLPHAFIDIGVDEWLVLRAGFFEAPIGAFNEYLWPAFVRTTGVAPLFSTFVVPGLWSELGLQLRGRVPVAGRAHVTYAAFVSNGLEQPDDTVGDGVVAEGGDLLAMRYNVRDAHSSDKAIGGRVGLQWGHFDVGASGYTGRYTIDASRRLSIADLDVSYRSRMFTFRAEGAASFQDVTGGWRTKVGAYGLVSSRVAPHLEPYLHYDFLNDRKSVQHRVLFGNAIYPFPNEATARTLRLKTEVGVTSGPERDVAFVWLTQLVSGF
jgi:hypothetical protein